MGRRKQTSTQETRLDPVLQAHLYGGTLPASAMTGIMPAYFRPGGSLERATEGIRGLYRGEMPRFQEGGPVLGLAEQVYQLTGPGMDLGAMLPQYEVAGLDPAQQQAYDQALGGIGAYEPLLGQATGAVGQGVGALGGALAGTESALAGATPYQERATELMNLGAETVAGAMGAYDPSSYQQFMDPFLNEVVQQAERDAARQAAILGRGVGGSAVGAGAFGGGREAVARAETARNLGDQLSRTTSQLRSMGFQNAQQAAMQAFENQQGRQLSGANLTSQIGQGLGSLGLNFGQLGLTGAGQMGQLGLGLGNLGQQMGQLSQLGQQMSLQDLSTLQQAGQMQQGQRQAELDAARMNEYQRVMAPFQQTAFRADILSGAPTGVSTTMTQPGPSLLSQGIGLGTALAGFGRMV